MTDPGRSDEFAARLNEERARLERVRGDYEAITRSRFHALRMLWFSIKQLFGRSSPDDVYAVWSSGLAPSMATAGRMRPGTPTQAALFSDLEVALADAWNRRMASRAMSDAPIVSIIIPAFNHRDVTVRCLRSIADCWFESLDVQVIVVDDGSTDATCDAVARLDGVDCIRSGRNEGFVRACNRGARIASGKYLCFLNNDTVVREGWLDRLVSTAEEGESIGVVGAKLVYPDGRLQEAGNIVWRDGSGWNVGRFDKPEDPRYNFVRDVDYVSGAALLVRRDLFERLGGFSEQFRPAYYEDADLCFGIRSLGYRVVYQPESVVVHYEGVSSAAERGGGAKRFQETNRPKFREKWSRELASHLENSPSNVPAASRRFRGKAKILVVDTYVPLYDREAGSQRMLHIVRMLLRLGYSVVFLPDNYAGLQPYTAELQQMGVEVIHHVEGGRSLQESLDSMLPQLDFAWISRPDLFAKYQPVLRRNRNLTLIFDTVDLCHVRQRREAELLGANDAAWRELLRGELECAKNADATVVVTAEEQAILEEHGIGNICVVPTIHEYAAAVRSFDESSGLLFIGSYNHPPNVDAVRWLCEQIMPLVWQSLPNAVLTLVGANATPEVYGLKSERIRVTGYVRDVGMYFRSSRVFVAPLRFGAGMKGKIGHALAYALPVVTTPVGAEGLGLRDGENAVIAEAQADAFAAAIVALYGDRQAWQRISDASRATLEPFGPEAVMPRLAAFLDRLARIETAAT